MTARRVAIVVAVVVVTRRWWRAGGGGSWLAWIALVIDGWRRRRRVPA